MFQSMRRKSKRKSVPIGKHREPDCKPLTGRTIISLVSMADAPLRARLTARLGGAYTWPDDNAGYGRLCLGQAARADGGCGHRVEPHPAEMAAGLKARIFSLRQPGREWYDAELCRFGALRGRARDGSLAAIMVVSLDLAGSIPGPASLWGFPTAQPGNPRVTLSPAHRPRARPHPGEVLGLCLEPLITFGQYDPGLGAAGPEMYCRAQPRGVVQSSGPHAERVSCRGVRLRATTEPCPASRANPSRDPAPTVGCAEERARRGPFEVEGTTSHNQRH